MKKAKVIALQKIKRREVDALFVGDIHDEWQVDVAEEGVEDLRQIFTEAFREAGEYFNYRLPIECDAKVGLTWAETH
jgi:DNA polymerase I-like protein with 3'-5' exonuclease and polymerase domains